MASYFDTSGSERFYVDEEIRNRDDFSDIADLAETRIIEHYRTEKRSLVGTARRSVQDIETGDENLNVGIRADLHTTDYSVVWLQFYKPDPANVTSSTDGDNFKDAMRRAIARMIEHIAGQRNTNTSIKSESRGQRSVTYRDGISQGLPAGVTSLLRPYDQKPSPRVL